jgi:hypothetical protein
MPHKKKPRRYITPLVLFTLAGWALWALGRNELTTSKTPDAETPESPTSSSSGPARTRATWSKRRLATSLAFATLFFGGAAFSAGAGDVVADAIEDNGGSEVAAEEAQEEQPAAEEENGNGGEESGAGEAPAESEEPPAESEGQPSEDQDSGGNGGGSPDGGGNPGDGGQNPGGGDGGGQNPGDGDGGQNPGGGDGSGGGGEPEDGTPPPPLPDGGNETPDDPPAPDPGVGDGPDDPSPPAVLPVVDKETRSPAYLDPEADADGFFATVWLHRPLPDPTPPAKRLRPAFATALAREAAEARVDWALLLGVLRARGFDSSSMSLAPVRSTAQRLADIRDGRRSPVGMLRAYGGEAFAQEALALRNYNRAVGLHSLVEGLEAAKPRLQRMLLRDNRVDIYPGGRLDVALGRTDVRVIVLLRYLAEAHGQVTVSSLTSGHRLYARPGVISAHVYGLAVDVAALNNTPIYGHQQPGGITEQAVRNILRLPAELQAKQVISLFGLGGPSFPLADHDDHIHVGY